MMKTGGFDICDCLVPTYIASLPIDPSRNESFSGNCVDEYDTGYLISRNASTSRITLQIDTTYRELETDISLTQ